MGHLLRLFACAVCVSLLCDATQAQPGLPTPDDAEILLSFRDGDYQRAADLLDESLRTSPGDALALYNAACARSRLGQRDLAAQFLLKAVQAGFKDFSHMQRDADLIAMRDHAMFRALVDARAAADAMLAQREVDKWRKEHGDEFYRYEHDEARRIQFITSLDETDHAAMRDMLDREADHLASTFFGADPRRYVIIVNPTPADAAKLLPDRHVHGTYKHMKGMLIAADTGASLRHEFFHALHHNHMDRVGQQHPLWIQEGLAALYEDYELDSEGAITFLPNERRNIAKSMARENRLLPLDQFAALNDTDFSAKPARNYVQARTLFEFLADRDLLEQWYHAYTRHFSRDTTGVQALMEVFNLPIADIDAAWRKWLDEQPTIVTQRDVCRETSQSVPKSPAAPSRE
jgi:hypothetical protein